MFGADRYNPAPLDLGGAELASMLSGNFSASPTYEVHAAEPLVTTAIANSGLSPAREVTASGGLTYEEAFNLAPRGRRLRRRS